jgi:hypothetical protein
MRYKDIFMPLSAPWQVGNWEISQCAGETSGGLRLEQIPIKLTRHCERSEAIQCCGAGLDCFVAPLLAMTALVPSDRNPL